MPQSGECKQMPSVQVGVPDRSVSSCLDPELPGTCPGIRAGQGDGEAEAGPGPPSGDGDGSWNLAEMKET